MKVVVVTYAFPPVYTACAVRWDAIVRELVDDGVHVTVLCAWMPGLPRSEMRGSLRIVRVGNELSTGLRDRIRRRYRLGSAAAGAARHRSGLTRRMLQFANRVWSALYWPDHACLWTLAATAALRKQLHASVDAVISVSFPFTDHVVAALAGSGQSGRVWIADNGDPFSFLRDTPPNNVALYTWLNRWAERRVNAHATFVTFPNDELRALYETGHRPYAGRYRVVPHVTTRSANSYPAVRPRDANRTVKLCYAGSFARAVRSPAYFLRCVPAIVGELRKRGFVPSIDLYGDLNDCVADLRLVEAEINDGTVRVHGNVAPAHARGALDEADVLINVGNATAYRQPSKVVEYMASGKPILNFATGNQDSSISLLASYDAALHLVQGTDDPADAAKRSAEFLTAPPPVAADALAAIRDRYSPRTIAQQYLALIAEGQSAADARAR